MEWRHAHLFGHRYLLPPPSSFFSLSFSPSFALMPSFLQPPVIAPLRLSATKRLLSLYDAAAAIFYAALR